ncbi:MAG: hypothetical protein JST38_08430 [Bacteroidetes bacterium]|nr:hypothetical protein [Bacteroidota bacterium]
MADEARDFLLDDSGRLVLRNGGIATGDSLTQEVALIMLTNQGEMRHDPLCGCNLIRRTNSRFTTSELRSLVRTQLERDGKDLNAIADGINLTTNA